MVTKVGMQSKFADALKDLLELEHDALEAYGVAIKRLESETYKNKMSEFAADHKNHINQILGLLETHSVNFTDGPDAKQWLTKGKVVLAGLVGDKAILAAMLTNEMDTNSAYERITTHADLWSEARMFVEQGLADERKHKEWIKSMI